MAAIARIFSRATHDDRSEGETIANLALFGFAGLVISLFVLSRNVESSAEIFQTVSSLFASVS
jgi:hypothetical protein